MNEIKIITDEEADVAPFLPDGWGEFADGAAITGKLRYVEFRRDGMPRLGIHVLSDGGLELDTFGHVYTMKLPGQVVIEERTVPTTPPRSS